MTVDIALGRSVQSPGLCLLTDGLLLIGSSQGSSQGFPVSAALLQIIVVFGFSGESGSPRTAHTQHPKGPGQPQLLVSRWEAAVSQAGPDCPISLNPDAFGYSLFFFCKGPDLLFTELRLVRLQTRRKEKNK